ncbi:fibronectin type III domain-containing protein [Candidatus Woesearchaeota archaeon]|nr:fibronectin type III domain-containing protein [Candidatus Woesearchaeota archaeon]
MDIKQICGKLRINKLKDLNNYVYCEQLIAVFLICLIVLLPVSFVDAFSIKYTAGKDNVVFNVDTDQETKINIRYNEHSKPDPVIKETDNALSKKHSVTLTQLIKPQTSYNYFVEIVAANNQVIPTQPGSFITLDNVDPLPITGLKSESVTSSSVKLTWDSVTPAAKTGLPRDNDFDKYLIYRDDNKIGEATTNEYADMNLAASTAYTYRVQERDRGLNVGPSSLSLEVTTLDPDITSPKISDPKILALTDTSASIEVAADEEFNLSLSYGTLPQNYDKGQDISVFKKQQVVSLINLIKNQAYFYSVKVCDSPGNCFVSDEFNFIAGSDVTPPVINAVIPRYANEFDFQVIGTTEAFTSVELYVNDQLTSRKGSNSPNQDFSLRAVNLRENRVNRLKLVAEDLAGNKAQLEGEVEVDDKSPEVNLTTRITPPLQAGQSSQANAASEVIIEGLPSKLARNELEIDGFVNEPVTITYSTSDINEKPVQVTNLNVTKIEANSITLTWDKVINVEKYVIYRASSPNIPIAVVSTQYFKDDNVKSGTTYKYQVAALRNNGILGESSKQYIAKTLLADGKSGEGNDAVNEVNISNFAALQETQALEATGPFKLLLQLKEGKNSVTIAFADKANNKVEFKKEIFVDTIPPVILDPTDLRFYSPSYSPAVEIKGKVDTPGATVMILVNGKCSGKAIPSSLSGILFKITTDYKCKVTADNQGNFKMNIELDKTGFSPDTKPLNLSRQGFGKGEFGGKAEAGAGTKYRDYQFDPKIFTRNEVRIIAIDENGLQSQEIKDFIEYRACGESGAWQIDIPATEFTPTIVYSEHLIRGFAQFGFNMYFKYQGAGDPKEARLLGEPRITELELSEADQKNFGHSQLLTSPQTTWSDDYKTGHALYTLAKWTKSEKELKKVKKLKLPIMIEFDYTQDIFGEQRRATQKTCVDITSLGLEHRLDVEGKIPEAFLNDAIGAIDQTLEVINQILEPLQKLQVLLLFSCLGSWIVLWVWNVVYVRWSCIGVWDSARGSLAIEENWPGQDEKFPTCEKGEDKKALSTEDKSTCTSCVQKLKKFRTWDMRMHLLCDRIFCPSVPDLNMHKRITRDVYLAGIGGKQNACEGRTEDFYFKSTEKVLQEGANKLGEVGRLFNYDTELKDPCKVEYQRNWENACLLMDEWKEATTDPDKKDAFGKVFSAVADMCKPKPEQKEKLVRQKTRDKDGNEKYQEFISRDGRFYESTESIEVQEGPASQEKKKGVVTIGEGTTTKRYSIKEEKPLSLGYDREGKSTGRLFVDKNNDGEISDDEIYKDTNNNGKIDDNEARATNYLDGKGESIDVSNNKALQDEFEPPGDYIADPTSGIIRAAQCVCIPALVGYLTLWKGILDAVKKCFQSVLITKKAQSGLCKSVLTVYICDLIYDVISCITRKYSAGAGTNVKTRGIGGFFAAMSGASNDVQNSVVNRYGESAIYKNLFSERKLIHALCVGAFTGDWDIDVQNFLQGQMKIPITSEGWVPTATRRFITADPNNDGLATYIYHIGAGLIAGSDVDWSLELICSNNNDCNQADNTAESNACDCAQGSRPGEQAIRIDGGRIRAGDSIGGTDEQGDRYIPLTQRIRYDKVRLRWSYKDNNGKIQTDEVVNPIIFTGGTPPVNCKFDAAEASFNCGAAVGELGTFKFAEKPRPKKQLYTVNDQIKLDAQIIKKSPNYQIGKEDARIAGLVGVQTSAKTDPKKQIPKWVVVSLYNQHNSPVNILRGASSEPVQKILERDGTYSTDAQATGAETDGLKIDWLLPDGFKIEERDFLKLVGTGSVSTKPVKDATNPNPPKRELQISVQPPIRGDTAEKAILVIAEKKEGKNICSTKRITSYTADTAAQGSRHIIVQEVEDTTIDSRDCKKGTVLRADLGGNLIVVIGEVTDDDFKSKAQYAVIYTPATSDASAKDSACTTGEKVQWRLEMALHHGLKENENLDWSATNFKTGTPGEIAQSKGQVQAYRGNDAIMIDVVCNQNAGVTAARNTDCDITDDGKVSQRCTCNIRDGNKQCGMISASDNQRYQYCYAVSGDDYKCRKTPRCPQNTEITPIAFPNGCVCNVDENAEKPGDCGVPRATDLANGKFCYKDNTNTQPSCYKSAKSAQQADALNDLENNADLKNSRPALA